MDLTKMTLAQLKEVAKEKGMKGVSTLKKQELMERIQETLSQGQEKAPAAEKKPDEEKVQAAERMPEREKAPEREKHVQGRHERGTRTPQAGGYREYRNDHRQENRGEYRSDGDKKNTQRTYNNSYHYNRQKKQRYHDGSDGLVSIVRDKQLVDVHPTEMKELDSGVTKTGILEVMSEGYGFIRCDNFLPGDNDVYVASQFIRRFGLRTGDVIKGNLRINSQGEKFSALLYMEKVNGRSPAYLYTRKRFEDLTPIFPNERIHLETPGSGVSMRMLDLIAPIGKGQRGMIVSQPKTGKTTLLKQVAKAVTRNHPKMHLIILLIDERPEEVTDIKESIEGNNVEVIYSTFDELPENHKRVSEMVIERAKRLVEGGEDVMILLDSITRLARAYNLTVTPSGRTLSGGLASYAEEVFWCSQKYERGRQSDDPCYRSCGYRKPYG